MPLSSRWETEMIRVLCLLLFSTLPAPAAVILTLSPSAEVISNGLVTFSGTIQNTGPSAAFLNDITLLLNPPGGTYLTSNQNFFFFNVPGVLLNNETYTGPIFQFVAAPNTPIGVYTGSVSLIGGDDEFAVNTLASANLIVGVPEPSTGWLLLGACCALRLRWRRR
ncbi:MAG: PEP-CTERM sorting domain-containing protein [Bryobacteraceae bacterium]|nr:PEP-CTERM sorting domain-containing protein [Bryobacteraceae bacterium]